MASVLEDVPHRGRILVIRLRSLGDCVLTTPALHLLKQSRPDVRLAVVAENRFRAVFEGNPDMEEVLEPAAAAVRRWRPHLCLNLHGGARSSMLTAVSTAKWPAGFAHFRHSFVYNVRIPTAQEILQVDRKVHTCEHIASAVFYLGVPMAEVPRARLYADAVTAGQYAVLHADASRPDKTWPAERFLAVARRLKDDFDLEPVFIGAHSDRLSRFRPFRTLAGAPLAAVKSLLKRAMLFVGNDSGPAHMAAAFGVPVVVLFGSSDPVIWGPWRTSSEILTHPAGIASLTVDNVLASLERMRARMIERLRLLHYARRYGFHILASVILMACVGAAQSLFVLLIQPIFDRVLNPSSPDAPVLLFRDPVFHRGFYLDQIVPTSVISNVWTKVAFAILMVFLLKGACDYVANYLINFAGVSAVTDLRNDVFDKVLKQGAQFFETTSTGRLMSSIMNDIEKIQVALSHILADLLRQSFVFLGLLFVVVHKDWKLAVVSLTVLPFVLAPTLRIGRRIRRTSRRTQDAAGELNQILQETLSGHQVVKAFGSEAYESRRFREAAQRLRKSNLRYVLLQAIASPIIELFGVITIVCLLTYARTEIRIGHMSSGDFVSFVLALLLMYEPVKRLTGIHNIFEQALGASQKVFEYLDHIEEIRDNPAAVALRSFERAIVFDSVSFRYPGTTNGFTLDSVSLEVKAGDVVALVGPSGAGKTTLVNLLPRFYDVTSGAVTIDGRAVGDLQLATLRGKIGIVAQDTFLFNDTVARNIAYGSPGAPREVIRRAAQSALAHEFIEELPQGYDTMIGERGVKLSGGQRQRLAIARALLKDAPILILDEATSHLDTESELLVQHALANLMADRTVIVIAHRLSTIRRADKIVVLDRGTIREIGTHEELVSHGGIYQRLHELQFVDASAVMDL